MFSLSLPYGGGTAQGKNGHHSDPRGVCLPLGRAKQNTDIHIPPGEAVQHVFVIPKAARQKYCCLGLGCSQRSKLERPGRAGCVAIVCFPETPRSQKIWNMIYSCPEEMSVVKGVGIFEDPVSLTVCLLFTTPVKRM